MPALIASLPILLSGSSETRVEAMARLLYKAMEEGIVPKKTADMSQVGGDEQTDEGWAEKKKR